MMHQDSTVLSEGTLLIANVLVNPSGSALNRLLSLFFKGLPITKLEDLLRHQNEDVIVGGLFIAEELGPKANPILQDIILRTNHSNPRVRSAAYNALGRATSHEGKHAFSYAILGIADADPECRRIAALWMMRVEKLRLEAALQWISANSRIQEGVQRLVGETAEDPSQVRSWILDADALNRRIGVIAAGRLVSRFPHLLDFAAHSEDPEVRDIANRQLHYEELKKRRKKAHPEKEKRTP